MSFALLAVDFILRLLLIEKKVAAKYDLPEDETHIESEQNQEDGGQEEGDGDGEEEPLLGEEFKVPPNQPKWIRRVPILYCLSDPRLLTAFLLALFQAVLLAAFDATVPIVSSDYFGFDSLKTGLVFIPLILPYLVLGPISGWAVDRYGTKPAAVGGFGYLVPVLIFLRLVQPGGAKQIAVYCALLALCGVGMAIIGAPSMVEAGSVVEKYHKNNPDFFGADGPYAQLYGINFMFFSAGLTLGPLIGGGLKDAVGYGNMNIVIAALSLISAILSYVYVGGTPGWLKRKKY